LIQQSTPRVSKTSTLPQFARLDKIVLNIGCGAEAVRDSKKAKTAQEDLTTIAGQKAMTTRAKKSIAGFRVREDMPLGAKVTLRGDRMFEFLDRLITVAMPRIRDFRGVSGKSFDGRGNYATGLKEHLVFPEIDFDKIDENWGMDIVICTTANTDACKACGSVRRKACRPQSDHQRQREAGRRAFQGNT